MSTTPSTSKAERDLVALVRRIDDVNKLNDRKVHLFMDLRAQKVTQARIGELAGMSDVGVHNAITRHAKRHEKAVRALAVARDDDERADAQAGICDICAGAAELVGADS